MNNHHPLQYKRYQGVVNRKGTPEHDLQVACVNWFRYQYPQLAEMLFAVPNGGHRSPIEAVNLRLEGVTAGVSDLIFLSPTNGAILIEMKTPTGRQSELQKLWEDKVRSYGYHYVVCRSIEDFQNVIKNVLPGVNLGL